MLPDGRSVTIHLYGGFLIQDQAETVLTPKGAKSQGLLALLATNRRFQRSRTWLQDKLWSDRGPEQGAASLRQALVEIRKALGAHSDILVADRKTVSLDPDRVTVFSKAHHPGEEFLEGIDVRDPEFDTWLASQRANFDMFQMDNAADYTGLPPASRPKPKARVVVLDAAGKCSGKGNILEYLFVDKAFRALRENLVIDVTARMPEKPDEGTVVACVQAMEMHDDTLGLRIFLEDISNGKTLWSDSLSNISSVDLERNVRVLGLINRFVEATGEALSYQDLNISFDHDASLLGYLAVRKLFSIGQRELESADRLLKQAYDIQPRGIFQAWRAQLLTIQHVERYRTDFDVLSEESEEACERALADDPTNSNVLAAVANARLILQKNFVGGGELAMMSVKSNSGNPLAWWSLSNAKQYFGENEAAYLSAVQAQTLAEGTRLKFWCDFQRSLTAATTGRSSESVRYGETSTALSPQFGPPLRYLTAVYANDDKPTESASAMKRLKAIEPDFNISRLLDDESYPVSVMRNTGLADRKSLEKAEAAVG